MTLDGATAIAATGRRALPWPPSLDARTATEAGPLHRAVMANEVESFLQDAADGTIVDCTVGTGGHSAVLLTALPSCQVVGIDRDPEVLPLAEERLSPWSDRVELVCADYRDLPELAEASDWGPIRGIVADLGLSSFQLDAAERGFSFQRTGPLDMRMDRSGGRTASDLLRELSVDELTMILRRYGEERHAGRIARAIDRARRDEPLRTTTRLAAIVEKALPRRTPGIHPATRTFQALRIAVNDELAGLHDFVVDAGRLLAPGGRLVTIAFHSLEDRPVKQAMRHLSSDCLCPPDLPVCACDKVSEGEILTSRPLRPRPQEVEANPRSRSARLRAWERS